MALRGAGRSKRIEFCKSRNKSFFKRQGKQKAFYCDDATKNYPTRNKIGDKNQWKTQLT